MTANMYQIWLHLSCRNVNLKVCWTLYQNSGTLRTGSSKYVKKTRTNEGGWSITVNMQPQWVKYCFSLRENKNSYGWNVIQSEFILCGKENLAADVTIDLFSLYVLFSYFTPRDGTPENCQIPSYARASRCILSYARFMKRQTMAKDT